MATGPRPFLVSSQPLTVAIATATDAEATPGLAIANDFPETATMSDWEHVAKAVRSRRIAEGRTQQEMAERAGVSLATWRLLETAGRTRYQDLTLRGVTRALGWGPDAIDRLLAGDDPGPQGESLQHQRAAEDPDVPVGLARRWSQLTADEQAKVMGFVEGLFAGRAD